MAEEQRDINAARTIFAQPIAAPRQATSIGGEVHNRHRALAETLEPITQTAALEMRRANEKRRPGKSHGRR
ncbi:hypothetical protein [Hyphomicrobium sp. 1Nfss2.1]|uniref:hypothetical protein n=1 Tax=Hyphomicrobium sp. 1Nfss2.1 TaxID=3413936 RepID=UPI003C79F1C2